MAVRLPVIAIVRQDRMKTETIAALCAMSCVLLMAGCQCHLIPTDVRSDPRVQAWIDQIKQDEDSTRVWWFIHMNVAGYNKAVWVGQIDPIDASPFKKNTDAKGLSLTKARVVYRERSVSSTPTLLFDSNTFTNSPFPKPGERWAVFGSANNSGIWFVHDAFKVDQEADKRPPGKP